MAEGETKSNTEMSVPASTQANASEKPVQTVDVSI